MPSKQDNHATANASAWIEEITTKHAAWIKADDDAREAIRDWAYTSALETSVRGGWYAPGSEAPEPDEFRILLTTGGPGLQVFGRLDNHGQPADPELQWQDWGTPWTRAAGLSDAEIAALDWFASLFNFDC